MGNTAGSILVRVVSVAFGSHAIGGMLRMIVDGDHHTEAHLLIGVAKVIAAALIARWADEFAANFETYDDEGGP